MALGIKTMGAKRGAPLQRGGLSYLGGLCFAKGIWSQVGWAAIANSTGRITVFSQKNVARGRVRVAQKSRKIRGLLFPYASG
jgi:hypothetical protein